MKTALRRIGPASFSLTAGCTATGRSPAADLIRYRSELPRRRPEAFRRVLDTGQAVESSSPATAKASGLGPGPEK